MAHGTRPAQGSPSAGWWCWAVTQAPSTAGKAGLCPEPRADLFPRCKDPLRSVLLPPDRWAGGDGAPPSSHLWAGSPGLAREKGTAGTPGSLPCPGNPLCLALPDSARPWPSIHFPHKEDTGLPLLKAWWSSLGLLRNCAEKQVPMAPKSSGPGQRNSQIPLARTQMHLREVGLCTPEGGLHAPCGIPLSLESAFQAPPLWEKPSRSSAKWKPFALVPIVAKSVQGSQRNRFASPRNRAFGSSQGLLPAMHIPGYPQGWCGPLVTVPVLLNCALESGGHQQNILWLMRADWQVSCPEFPAENS